MGLPWIRLDTDFFHNPKILRLLATGKHRAVTVHLAAMCWTGQQGMGGFVPDYVLALISARRSDVKDLVAEELWHVEAGGWSINGWAEYQLTDEASMRRLMRAKKGGCVKNHGPDCGCWQSPSTA